MATFCFKLFQLCFVLSGFMVASSSCNRPIESLLPSSQDSVDAEKPSPPDEDDIPPSNPVGPVVHMGEGNNEDMVIDGEKTHFDCHTTVYIKGGNYRSITIKNVQQAAGCPVTFTNDGLIILKNAEMRISNASHITVTGDVANGDSKGFSFLDNSYRALVLSDRIHHVTLSNMSFSNVRDYVISYNNQTIYKGTDETATKDLRIRKMDCEKSGPFINFSGSKNGSTVNGMYRGLEIAYINYRDSPSVGIVVYVPNAESFNIHHNTFNNVNTKNDNHNAMFQIHGNGEFHNNYISNFQGNSLRARPFSFGNTAKELLIYNNIVVNSRKYSAFEVQTFAEDLIGRGNTYANIKVFNNTCGNLNLSSDWYGVVLDAYTVSGAKCEVFNNLAFHFPAPHPKSMIVSYMGLNDNDLIEHDNYYYRTANEAGITDENSLKLSATSPAKNNGLKVATLTLDYYGALRNTNKPSVGAVE